jgi:APA family basic amino acid/polyamine antiporter
VRTPDHEPSSDQTLPRVLGLWPAVAVVIGTAIGSGIFLVPSDMVKAVGSPGMVFAVWVFGGVLTLFGALTYAELSAALPGAGGEFVYLNAAYGPFFGFVYGWTQTWVAKSASIATLATGFYTYLADFFPGLKAAAWTVRYPIGPNGGPLEIRYGQLFAIGLILFLAGINYLGVRLGGGVQVAMTALKLALIAGIIACGLIYAFSGASTPPLPFTFHSTIPANPGGVAGFFAALVAALWAYDGWNNAGMLGSEIENPQRNLPLALIGGTLAMVAVYLLVNFAYFSVLSGAEVGASERVASEMMRRVFSGHEHWSARGAGAVSIAAMISIFAALNGSILSGSRIPFAMTQKGYFFHALGRVHPRFQTPGASILLLGFWSSLLLLSGHYKQLYTLVIFPSWILYAMTAASVIVLRRTQPRLERPFKVPGYPVVPILFVLVAIGLLYSTLLESPRESGIGFGIIVAGLPFYFYWKRAAQANPALAEVKGNPSV